MGGLFSLSHSNLRINIVEVIGSNFTLLILMANSSFPFNQMLWEVRSHLFVDDNLDKYGDPANSQYYWK